MKLNQILGGCLFFVLFEVGSPKSFAALLFDRSTDTVRLQDRVVVTSAATYEAWVQFTCDYAGFGYVFCQWYGAGEDKQLRIGPDRIEVFNFRGFGNPTGPLGANVSFPLGVPHHVAYVFDGSEERIYLDGNLVARQGASGNIVNDQLFTPVAGLGNYNRGTDVNNAFIGYLFSLRITGAALYTGTSFQPPALRLGAITGTQLVYNFDCSQTIGQEGVLPYPCPGCNPTSPTCVTSVPTALLALQNTVNGRSLVWNPQYILFSSSSVDGAFLAVPGAASPFLINTQPYQQQFFRLGCP